MKVSKPLFHSNNDVSHLRKIKKKKKKLRKTLLYLGRLRIVILSSNRVKFNYSDQAQSFIRVQLQISRRKDGKEKWSRKERWELQKKRRQGESIIYHPAVYQWNRLQMLFNLPDGKPLCFPSFLPRATSRVPLRSYRHSFALLTSSLLSSLLPPYFLLSSPFRPFTIPYRALYTFLLHFPPFISSRTVSSFS